MTRVVRLTKPCPDCGKSLHAEAIQCSCGWRDLRAAAKASRSERHACSAFGCPLPGTMYAHAQATEGWCYVHDAHRDTLDLQRLTAAINDRKALFDAAYALIGGITLTEWWTTIPGRFGKPFREAGRDDLLPTPDERKLNINVWLARVRNALEVEILRDCGLDVKSGKRLSPEDERRKYAPTDEDIEAAKLAELAIANGTWRRPADVLTAEGVL